jgi:2-acylglycerol O-acyltransferase 2
MAQYLPVTLHKTGDIPAEGKGADAASPSPMGPPYIFCYHPHGVISVGWNLGLNTNAAGFDELFPGLQNRFGVTLSQSFCFPLFREYMMALGFISCKKQVMVHRLLAGDSLALVPGGAPEALHALVGVSRLAMRSPFGFLKLAQQHQVSVVPCFAFGENNAFHIPITDMCPTVGVGAAGAAGTVSPCVWRSKRCVR